MAPESDAPELMGFAKPDGWFFPRQPETPGELDHAINAVRVSCVEALRYAGRDTTVLERLHERGCGHLCDAPLRVATSNTVGPSLFLKLIL
jgi:hypothetical protein